MLSHTSDREAVISRLLTRLYDDGYSRRDDTVLNTRMVFDLNSILWMIRPTPVYPGYVFDIGYKDWFMSRMPTYGRQMWWREFADAVSREENYYHRVVQTRICLDEALGYSYLPDKTVFSYALLAIVLIPAKTVPRREYGKLFRNEIFGIMQQFPDYHPDTFLSVSRKTRAPLREMILSLSDISARNPLAAQTVYRILLCVCELHLYQRVLIEFQLNHPDLSQAHRAIMDDVIRLYTLTKEQSPWHVFLPHG